MIEITKSDSLFEVGAVARASRDTGCFSCGGPLCRKNCLKGKQRRLLAFLATSQAILRGIVILRETHKGFCLRQQ